MDIIKHEIKKIKDNLILNFKDPIPNQSLKLFITDGKFIRSKLALLYLKSQNCEITNNILKILEAGETLHSASLLHDDVLDEAEIRRGKTVLAKEFNQKVAILAGDFLVSKVIEKLIEINDFDIIANFKNCTASMTETELKQYFLREKLYSEKEYIEICQGKTASLFATILKSCAKLSNISEEKAEIFGINFGIFFQIKNDLNPESAKLDKMNKIYTAKDIIGIEKTNNLLDNYKEEMSKIIDTFPENIYKKNLKDLINLV